MYQSFNTESNDAMNEPMFLGNSVSVARYDQQKHAIFEKLIEKQLSFFWRPEEVDVSRDRSDYARLSEAEKHIFISNLKYQTLLDSIQGRSPNVALLPLVSTPELETWIETWSFSETIHSRSYTHILRNVMNDPGAVFDSITDNPEIQKRAADVSRYYDELIYLTQVYHVLGAGKHVLNGKEVDATIRNIKKALYLTIISVNALEGIRFYVSFACTFAFSERELMEGNAKIIKLIARDENLHLLSTQSMLNLFHLGQDDPEMKEIAKECHQKALAIVDAAVKQEKEWAKYLFKDGSMLGLNEAMLCQYVEYIANIRLQDIGWEPRYDTKNNPLPWMNKYLVSDNVQVAPQESEITSYLVGQIDSEVSSDDFGSIEL
jgi:ribonucleoside-diphosphate reductase beta chain